MRRHPPPRLLLLTSAALAALLGAAQAADWPQWRGPNRDGVWQEEGIVEAFPGGGPQVLWRAEVGPGYSQPSVAEGRVYVTDRQRQEGTERVLCFDVETGERLWVHAYRCAYEGVDYDSGPRAAPTVHEGKVYTLGTMGHLFCLDAASGAVVWSHDFVEEYGTRVPMWGISGSPLVEGELLICNVGGRPDGTLMAFDLNSGEEVWRSLDDAQGYGSPVAIEAGGRRQVVFWSAEAVVGVDPETGEELWRQPFRAGQGMSIITPVKHGDYLFVSSFFDGSILLELAEQRPAVEPVWGASPRDPEREVLHGLMSNPLFIDDHFYAIDSYGQFRCIEVASGEQVWETQDVVPNARWSNAHLVQNGDRVFIWTELGELIIARLSPEGYEEIDRVQLLEPTVGSQGLRAVIWSHPAFAERSVFVRNDRELIRVSLAAP